MSSNELLLVEDDLDLAEMVAEYLRGEGYEINHASDGLAAVEIVRCKPPDLVLLDIMLPGLNGIEVCRQLRDFYQGPILMLTANDDDMVEVTTLNLGANGYLRKPVRPHVLLAHIQAQLRSRQERAVIGLYTVQDIVVDTGALSAVVAGDPLSLTSSEFKLLCYLCENAGRVLLRDHLFEVIRGIPFDGLDRSIDMQISALRKKMGDNKPPYRYIKTVRSQGYMLAIR